jgi:hypothetical protein
MYQALSPLINPVTLRLALGALRPKTKRSRSIGSGGTNNIRYCYAVWMRHLLACQEFLPAHPSFVAEVGPGDSLGVGITALLCGAKQYLGLDAVAHRDWRRDASMAAPLAQLVKHQAQPPGDDEFPKLLPKLDFMGFPTPIKPSATGRLVNAIETTLETKNAGSENQLITYFAPWQQHLELLPQGKVDFLFSQGAMEFFDDLPSTYKILARCLSKGGVMSHQIDLSAHGLGPYWYSHWTYSDALWSLLVRRRLYWTNRLPLSAHMSAIEAAGLKILQMRSKTENAAPRSQLVKRFTNLDPRDLKTSSVHVVAQMTA